MEPSRYALQVLGSWSLTTQDGEPVGLRLREQRLVAALALNDWVGRGELARLLWPTSTRHRAHGSLRAAVFNVRHTATDLIVEHDGRLKLSDWVTADITQLLHTIRTAQTAPPQHLEQVIAELDGPELLVGWYDDWVCDARESLQTASLDALRAIAATCLRHGQPDLAQAAAAAAVAAAPAAEECLELLIQAHLALGEPLGAIQEFERAKKRLLDETGFTPSEHLRCLAYGISHDIPRKAGNRRAERSGRLLCPNLNPSRSA